MTECSCSRIALGTKLLEQRNWNPECGEHGLESTWWNSEEEVERRRQDRDRLIELQRKAREMRRKN